MKLNFQVIKGQIVPYSQEDRETLSKLKDGAIYCVEVKNMDQRTLTQNRSLHLWAEMIAKELNKNDMFITNTIKLNTKWDMIKVKELLIKPVLDKVLNKKSTTKMEKKDFDILIDSMVIFLGKKGITVPDFPNREDM